MKWLKKNKHLAALLPPFLFIGFVVMYGLMVSICESLSCATGWTFEHYTELFHQKRFLDSLGYSLKIAGLSTILSLLIGLIVTKFAIHHLVRQQSRLLVWMPMLFPHFVWGYMMILLFSQSGWVSSLFSVLGIISDPSQFPVLIQDENGIGIILTYVWKEVPFVVLLLLPVYMDMPKQLTLVVRTLGGSRWNVFKTVEWPWVFPVLVEAGIIVFAFVIAAFELPYLLGTTYPEMVSVLAYDWFFQGDWSKRPLSYAVMISITVLVFLLMATASALMNKRRYHMMRGTNR